MSRLFVKDRGQRATTLGKQPDPLWTRDRNRAHIPALLINRCMEGAQIVFRGKPKSTNITDLSLPPVPVPGEQNHFHLFGNTQGQAVVRGIQKPFTGKTPATLKQLRFDLCLPHCGSP
jgi:hypothetical protein